MIHRLLKLRRVEGQALLHPRPIRAPSPRIVAEYAMRQMTFGSAKRLGGALRGLYALPGGIVTQLSFVEPPHVYGVSE